MTGGRDVPWMWLVVGVDGYTLDVAGGRDGPWMWLALGMEGWTMDVAGVKDAWIRGMRAKPLKSVRMIGQ